VWTRDLIRVDINLNVLFDACILNWPNRRGSYRKLYSHVTCKDHASSYALGKVIDSQTLILFFKVNLFSTLFSFNYPRALQFIRRIVLTDFVDSERILTFCFLWLCLY